MHFHLSIKTRFNLTSLENWLKTTINSRYLYEKKKETFQRPWRDKEKENSNKRNEGFKPSFKRNCREGYQQNKHTQDESKMKEPLGKRGILPLKCFGCQKYHLYRYFPHMDEKLRTFPNIQEATPME